MANKRFWLGILVIALVFGTTIIGCDDSDDDSKKPEPGIPPYIPSVPDALTGIVTITGITTKGSVLTADTSSLGGSGTITYRWKKGDTQVAINTSIGTNSSTYTLTNSDLGKYIDVTVSRADNSGSVSSGATDQVDFPWIKATTTLAAGGVQLNDVVYGNNQYVAVGSVACVIYSADGQTWTSVGPLNTIFTNGTSSVSIKGIAYGDNKWIAVGERGKMATSPNVISSSSWTEITSPFAATTSINTVLYAGTIWIVGGDNGSMYYSSDGTTWTLVSGNPFGTSAVQSIAYNSGKWIAVGANGKMFTSTTGTTWTSVNVTSLFTYTYGSSSTVQTIKTVAYANNKWIAAANAGGLMATSFDGSSWTAATGLSNSIIQSVAYGNSKWIAALGGGRTAISTDNGSNWVVIPNTIFSSDAINGIAFANNKWVAVGAGAKVAYANDN